MASSFDMNHQPIISTARLEAFSDGVIAIIITIMVFDLKFPTIPTEETLWNDLQQLIPKFLSYALSFLMLAIMWVNHHQLFHQIKKTDRKLLWLNIHLLFWMSLIPFSTNFLGANPLLPPASFAYGIVFFANAMSFALIRNYVSGEGNLVHESIQKDKVRSVQKKNWVGMLLFVFAALVAFISVYISFIIFLIVPAMYFIPQNILHESNTASDGNQ
jgi:uncharacterized membrane protein